MIIPCSDPADAVQSQRRHHIPKQRYRVRNWQEYDAALLVRGSLTVWFSDEAVERWRGHRQLVDRLAEPGHSGW
ncbi:hypothetical protein EJ903_22340 [Azospirillum griseum]|uniref:Transposase DDE domain-containing protein n=1 Tax=Azospirillum griseum TaxID=2496639 RepID=A0A431VBU3_9PROT|nr:hypothetical protein EJ903_22340 [Azospirillum griseum]